VAGVHRVERERRQVQITSEELLDRAHLKLVGDGYATPRRLTEAARTELSVVRRLIAEARALDPDTVRGRRLLLIVEAIEGDVSAANEIILWLMEKTPESARSRAAIGSAHFLVGSVEQSRQAYLGATALDPSDATLWAALADVASSTDDLDLAYRAAKRAVETDPYNPVYAARFAGFATFRGSLDEATRAALSASQGMPWVLETQAHAAALLFETAGADAALKWVEMLRASDPVLRDHYEELAAAIAAGEVQSPVWERSSEGPSEHELVLPGLE